MNFGEWIRKVQAEKLISEEECYTRAGMTQPNWSRLVNNPPAQPRKATMIAVARALNEPLAQVFAAAGYDDDAQMDTRIARQIETYLMKVPANKRPTAERMAVDYVRQISELLTV